MRLPRLRALPLLSKELTEQSSRRRTYLIRVVVAVSLYLVFAGAFRRTLFYRGTDALGMLGQGTDMFDFLVGAQLVAIYVFLPAMMSGVLTREKERATISLLLLTSLHPWEIVIEKLLGRLVPMLTVMLLSLPLLAVAYAFGGITTNRLLGGVCVLLAACLQVGAISLMFSAYCRTTAQAFILSYVFCVVFYSWAAVLSPLAEVLGFGYYVADRALDVWCWLFPAYVYGARVISCGDGPSCCIPVVFSGLLFLVIARCIIVRRAFAQPRHLMKRMLKKMDAFWNRLNVVTAGIVLWREKTGLPEDEPVAWREVKKKTLGQTTHLIRFLVVIEVVTIVVLLPMFLMDGDEVYEFQSFLLALAWPAAVLEVVVHAASALPSERSRQTLDILLTTPMSGPQIVRQKLRGIRRLLWVMAAPLFTIVLAPTLLDLGGVFRFGAVHAWETGDRTVRLLGLSLAIVVYLPMFAWMAMWIGLKSRSPGRSVLWTVVTLSVWIVGPLVLAVLLDEMFRWDIDDPPHSYLLLLSPAAIIGFLAAAMDEIERFFEAPILVVTALSFCAHGGLLIWLRWLCLSRADRYMGRLGPGGEGPRGVPDQPP